MSIKYFDVHFIFGCEYLPVNLSAVYICGRNQFSRSPYRSVEVSLDAAVLSLDAAVSDRRRINPRVIIQSARGAAL